MLGVTHSGDFGQGHNRQSKRPKIFNKLQLRNSWHGLSSNQNIKEPSLWINPCALWRECDTTEKNGFLAEGVHLCAHTYVCVCTCVCAFWMGRGLLFLHESFPNNPSSHSICVSFKPVFFWILSYMNHPWETETASNEISRWNTQGWGGLLCSFSLTYSLL